MRVHSLAFQWLGLTPLTAKGTGSIPGHDPQAMRHGQKKKNHFFTEYQKCLKITLIDAL